MLHGPGYGSPGGPRVGFNTARICANGHVLAWVATEHNNQAFCTTCGASSTTTCPNGHAIRGSPKGWAYANTHPPPNYCHECGQAYPWISAQLQAAAELIEMEEAEATEREALKTYVATLTKDSPQQTVALVRIGNFLGKASKPVAEGLKKILTEVGTQGALALMRAHGLIP